MKFVKILLLILTIAITSCTSIRDNYKSPNNIGNGFLYYAPDESRNYEIIKIEQAIEYHIQEINKINKNINHYSYQDEILDEKFNESKISKNKYEVEKENINKRLNNLKYDKREATKALEKWKELLNEKETANFKKPPDKKPRDCYIVTISGSDYVYFRNKSLTREEINSLNSCKTQLNSKGELTYEDLNRADCQIKKRIDDETYIGLIAQGTLVELKEKEASSFRIVNIETGQEGFISAKVRGKSTLIKTSCN